MSHNTLVVDESDTRDAELTGLSYQFSPEVKFLSSSANGVFAGVSQSRSLLLTKEYLLDVVHAISSVPHTYDYVLHSFGRAEPHKPNAYVPTNVLMKRYWLVERQNAMKTNEPWTLDFVVDGNCGAQATSTSRGSVIKQDYD